MTNFIGCRAVLGAVCLALVGGCGDDGGEVGSEAITLRFAARVGEEPFSCAGTFEGLGTSGSAVKPLDFRMYIHDVRLVGADGAEVPLALDQDGTWQRDGVAFLDFEDGTGTCKTGSPETHTEVTGVAPRGDYVGVRFVLGLPREMNHLDAATAPPPLNIPGMWWSWRGGYKFVRLDLETTTNPAYYFHLGATSCEGTVKDGFSCALANLAEVALSGVDPASGTVVFDLASFYAESDLDRQVDMQTDFVAGCMAFEGDPECPPVFEALGMPFGEGGQAGEQRAFRVE